MSAAHADNDTAHEEPKHAARDMGDGRGQGEGEGHGEGQDLEFHCFQKYVPHATASFKILAYFLSRLPIELRQKIWGMAAPPRGMVIQRMSK